MSESRSAPRNRDAAQSAQRYDEVDGTQSDDFDITADELIVDDVAHPNGASYDQE